jgi:hypothetical protein
VVHSSYFHVSQYVRYAVVCKETSGVSIEEEAIALVSWLGIIRDLRTALEHNPLPIDVLKELLGKTASN